MDQFRESSHPLDNTQVPEWETPSNRKRSHRFSLKSISTFKGRGGSLPHHADGRIVTEKTANKGGPHDQQDGYVRTVPQSTSYVESGFDNQRTPQKQNRKFSPYLRDRKFWIIGAIIFIVVLALAVGLGVGLSKKSHRFLPLPSDTQTFTGDLTYYGPGLGACGVTSSSTDDIVSISHFLFDSQSRGSNPNANPLCGRKVRADRFDESVNGNRSVDLTVVDRCTGCQPTDLDVSPGAFGQLADQALGRVTVTWAWIS